MLLAYMLVVLQRADMINRLQEQEPHTLLTMVGGVQYSMSVSYMHFSCAVVQLVSAYTLVCLYAFCVNATAANLFHQPRSAHSWIRRGLPAQLLCQGVGWAVPW